MEDKGSRTASATHRFFQLIWFEAMQRKHTLPPAHVRRAIMKAPRGLAKALVDVNRSAAISSWITLEFGDTLSADEINRACKYVEDSSISILRFLVDEHDELKRRTEAYESEIREAVLRLNDAYKRAATTLV
jgi:hypothetical protein